MEDFWKALIAGLSEDSRCATTFAWVMAFGIVLLLIVTLLVTNLEA